MQHSSVRKKISGIAWLIVSAGVYIQLGYYTERSDFSILMILFGIAFLAYSQLINNEFPIKKALAAAFVLRLLLLFSIPALSDDYYRFIWDGILLKNNLNPYLYLPSSFYPEALSQYQLTETLYAGLNSKNYFTVYPPLSQLTFWLSTAFTDSVLKSVMLMRVVLLLAEAGIFALLLQILHKKALPEKQVYWYAFNPLIIMELTGNLHFEGLMFFFILLAVYLLYEHRVKTGAIFLAAATAVKLLPLVILPFLLKRVEKRRLVAFYALFSLTLFLFFLPFLSKSLFLNFFSSIDLYFQKFEFNASFYYLAREMGFLLTGYNQISVIGPALSVITFILILVLTFTEKHITIGALFGSVLGAYTIYSLLATTVHPWYLTTLIGLATCTQFRYPMVWSAVAVLSYAAYNNETYSENYWLIFLEYVIVLAWLFAELYIYRLRIPIQNLIQNRKAKSDKL